MPASIASWRWTAMSAVKTGVSASRPMDDAGVAGGDRPAAVDRLRGAAAERGLGQRREDQREPEPDQELRRQGQQDLRLRQQPEAGEAAGDEDRAGGRAGTGVGTAARAGCRGSPPAASPGRRSPPRSGSAASLRSAAAPAGEGRGDRRRDHRQGQVPPEGGAAGPAQLGLDDPGRGLVPGDGEDRHRGEQRHRHLEQEDRLPGDQLGEDASDRRPERRSGGPGADPDRGRPRLRNRPWPAAAPAPR